MKTEDMIARLAQDPATLPLRPARIGSVLLGLVGLCVAVFLLLAGVRAGIAAALSDPLVAAKTILPAALGALALAIVLRLMRPEGRVSTGQRAVAGMIVAATAAIYALGYVTQDRALWFADLGGIAVLECLGFILLISTPALALSFSVVSRGATTSPALTGAALGLAVSAGATVGYSFYCTQDNPIFYVTWYGAAILLVTSLGAVAGARLLRW